MGAMALLTFAFPYSVWVWFLFSSMELLNRVLPISGLRIIYALWAWGLCSLLLSLTLPRLALGQGLVGRLYTFRRWRVLLGNCLSVHTVKPVLSVIWKLDWGDLLSRVWSGSWHLIPGWSDHDENVPFDLELRLEWWGTVGEVHMGLHRVCDRLQFIRCVKTFMKAIGGITNRKSLLKIESVLKMQPNFLCKGPSKGNPIFSLTVG